MAACRPSASGPPVQPKPANSFRLETRPAPPVYRPQQASVSPQPKMQTTSVQPQSQYELSTPVWIGNGRQQIRVRAKGAPAPVGSVDLHFKGPGKAFISDLHVSQSHRQHGLGTMLMKAALDSARRQGSIATELEANPDSGSISKQALVSMYQKLGFRNTGFSRRGNPKMSIQRIAMSPVRNCQPFSGGQGPIQKVSSRPLPNPVARFVNRNTAAIQRAREMFEQSHNYMVVDQPGWYRQHVKQRMEHTVNVLLRVLWYHIGRQKGAYQPLLRRASSSMSQAAEAQAAGGVYIMGGPKHDAAHLMNVTVRDSVLAEGQHLSADQVSALEELRLMSAATTMQLKGNNVGPDKVIDTCTTAFTQKWARQVDRRNPLPDAEQLVEELANDCLTSLKANKKSANANYQEAIAGATDALGDAASIGHNINEDVKLWLQEQGF